MEFKTTKPGDSYWNGTGAYQKECSELHKKLVPSMGSAKTLNGELIRIANNLFYEYNNNGNCNAYETNTSYERMTCSCCHGSGVDPDSEEEENCQNCGGSGSEEEESYDYVLSERYEKFFSLINVIIKDKELTKNLRSIEDLIISRPNHTRKDYFTDENQALYSYMMDFIIYYCLTHEDTEIPSFYEIE